MAKGLDDLLKKLDSVKNVGFIGMVNCVNLIKAEAQKITPVDKSFLINSAGTDTYEKGSVIIGEIFYTQDYAPYVHEMPADTNWQKPTAENKFLEKAVTRNEQQLMTLLKESVEKMK